MTTIDNQTNIFSMFDITDEVAEQKKKEQEERQRKAEEMKKKAAEAAEKSTTTKKSEKEKFEVNDETFIFHLGKEIPVTDYFSSEEIEEGIQRKKKGEVTYTPIDGGEVRKRMEKQFPDLVAKYTQMVYVEKKNMIMPVAVAKKKGCMKGGVPNGDSFSSFKKIPFSILGEFIRVANHFYEEHESEVHGDIYYLIDKDTFLLDIPKQRVAPLECEVTETPLEQAEKIAEWLPAIKVVEIHSHHTMQPTPSSQDDMSERNPNVLYAIVGNIHHYFPDITLRGFNSNSETHYSLPTSKIFESPFKRLETEEEFDFEVQMGWK